MARWSSGDTPRPYVENEEFLAFARRILRALGRRAKSDIDLLDGLAALGAELDAVTQAAVDGCRDDGHTWDEIAQRLGTTRQAAHQRFGPSAEQRQDRLDTPAITRLFRSA